VPADTVLAVKGSRFITHNRKRGDADTAAEVARGHDERVDDAAYGSGANHRLRHVLEVRHPSFVSERWRRSRVATGSRSRPPTRRRGRSSRR
jgi:hypothetical protein